MPLIQQGPRLPREPIAPTVIKPTTPRLTREGRMPGRTNYNSARYNVRATQSLSGAHFPATGYGNYAPASQSAPARNSAAPVAAGVGLVGFSEANAVRVANEARAAQYGLKAVYNAPQIGEAAVSGWGSSFGEAFVRSGGDASRINVAYVNKAAHAAGRSAAIAEEVARGHSVVEEAYQYVKLEPTAFSRFGQASGRLFKNILSGVGEAANAFSAFSFIPAGTLQKAFLDFMGGNYSQSNKG